eukprot:g7142.t1
MSGNSWSHSWGGSWGNDWKWEDSWNNDWKQETAAGADDGGAGGGGDKDNEAGGAGEEENGWGYGYRQKKKRDYGDAGNKHGLTHDEFAYSKYLSSVLRHPKDDGDAFGEMDDRGFVESVHLKAYGEEGEEMKKQLLQNIAKLDTKCGQARFEVFAENEQDVAAGRMWVRAVSRHTVSHLTRNFLELKKPKEVDDRME